MLPVFGTPGPARRPATPLVLALVVPLFSLGGCGGDAPPQGLMPGDRPLEVEVEDRYRVGEVAGGTWDSFTGITSAAFDDDGALHLLDAQQGRVHVVNPDGTHRLSFGRAGEGPGEFRSAAGITLLAEGWRPEAEPPRTATGAGGFGVAMAGGRALEPRVHLAVFPDGRLAVADSSAYRIRVYGPEGRGGPPPAVVERAIAPLPVTPGVEAAERDRRLTQLESGGGPRIQIRTEGPGGAAQEVPQEQILALLREQMAQVTFWHEIPVITRLMADGAGRLWVLRSNGLEETGPLDLFDPAGGYLGTLAAETLALPVAFGPDGLAAWVERDELDVPFVRVGVVRVGPAGAEAASGS